MTPATEAVLNSLVGYLQSDPAVGCVVVGGFTRTSGGKELVERLAPGGLLCVIGLDPVDWERPTQGQRENSRWQEHIRFAVSTLRRLGEGADVYGTRLNDGAWLATDMADFCDRLEDTRSLEAQELINRNIAVKRAAMPMQDYSPGEGADIDAGFVSVAASLEIDADVACDNFVLGEPHYYTYGGGTVIQIVNQFRLVHGAKADTVPVTVPDLFRFGRFSLYYCYKGLDAAPRFKVLAVEVKVTRVACDVDMTFPVVIAGIGGAPDKTYSVPVLAGAYSGTLIPVPPDDVLALASYQDVTIDGQTDTPPGVAPEGVEVWLTTEYVP